MRVIETIPELRALSDSERSAGARVALIPTMGALHRGHLSLLEEGRKRADRVWVSIFVNPTQFEDAADLSDYPRTLEADLACCRAAGVDAVFAPDASEMYAPSTQTWVEVTELAKPLCGSSRPGHFRGVATIVAKLLLTARPHVAVFGEKDYQQLAIIRRMVRDLGLDVEIAGGAIVREPDGLALSSRNRQLHPEARREATALVRALNAAQAALAAGERDTQRLVALAGAEIRKAPLARIDYVDLRDPDSLEPIGERLEAAGLLALAVFMRPPAGAEGQEVRLIDNRLLQP
jgi:pantoate--beta-alanine ligase